MHTLPIAEFSLSSIDDSVLFAWSDGEPSSTAKRLPEISKPEQTWVDARTLLFGRGLIQHHLLMILSVRLSSLSSELWLSINQSINLSFYLSIYLSFSDVVQRAEALRACSPSSSVNASRGEKGKEEAQQLQRQIYSASREGSNRCLESSHSPQTPFLLPSKHSLRPCASAPPTLPWTSTRSASASSDTPAAHKALAHIATQPRTSPPWSRTTPPQTRTHSSRPAPPPPRRFSAR